MTQHRLFLLLVLFFTPAFYGISAQNLVPNSSFEQYTSCPSNANEINKLVSWNNYYATPDYFHCGYTYSGVGNAVPNSGGGSVGGVGSSLVTESIYCSLLSPMISGQTYTVSFYLRVDPNFIIHNPAYDPNVVFGIYLYNSLTNPPPPPDPGINTITTLTPQAAVASTSVTSGTYVQHSFTITASDNYNQLIIGPFNLAPPTSPTLTAKFFNFDDLSIVAADPCPLTGSGPIWIWEGSNGTDWFDKCNWNRNAVPDCNADVVVPNTANSPVIAGAQALCNTIEVQSSSGANLEINVLGGGSLKVKSVTGTCP